MEAGAGESENDVLLSSERLSNDSPVMWPDQQHFCKSKRTSLVGSLKVWYVVCVVGDFNPLVSEPGMVGPRSHLASVTLTAPVPSYPRMADGCHQG